MSFQFYLHNKTPLKSFQTRGGVVIQNSALNMSRTSRTDWWNNALNSSGISLVSDQNVKSVQPLFNLKDLLTPS